MFESGIKFVVLDEVDYMTKNAQQALKHLLQTSSNNVRYCLICNYISKIDESLKNEFICIRFNQLPKQDIYQFIKNIAKNENLNINQEIIETIQSIYNSDVRSMINFIQLNQNLQESDWKTNVMNNKLLETLHGQLLKPKTETSTIELIKFMHKISIQYNVDKKHIIQSYFNFIIRNHKDLITLELLSFMEEIVHNPDASLDTLLHYFYLKLNEFYARS